MFESIKKIKEQFLWVPEIQGKPFDFTRSKQPPRVIVCGMGGSNVASGFLEMLRSDLEVVAHRSYGLPANVSKADLIIISSYSGNTEEALDSFEEAVAGDFRVLAISVGGELLKRAKDRGVSFIEIPKTDIEPRMALGYSLLAMLKAIGSCLPAGRDEENLEKAKIFGEKFNSKIFEKEGRELAEKLRGKVPIIYSSWNNKAIAYAWKIKFTETTKVPAFFNVFPELNHHEIVGFLTSGSAPEGVCGSALNPYFIFLKDSSDHSQIQKRMEITRNMLEDAGFKIDVFDLDTETFEKIFNSLVIADWTSYHLAKNSGFDPEDSSVIEDFKNRMKS